MPKIAYINKVQADSLVGVAWRTDSYFSPVRVSEDVYFIGQEEIEGNVNPSADWTKALPLTDYVQP